jgi:hypothetical protein
MSTEFSEPRVNVIESNTGFVVEVLGRTGIRYTEGERSMFIDSEAMATPGVMALYSSSIKRWGPPHESDDLGSKDRERIIENIRRGFEFKGHKLEVV